MNNFEFYNPVRILFGKDQIKNITKQIPPGVKVLVLYGGGSVKKNGVYDQVISALVRNPVVEFGGIQPNPQYETLMEAVELARKENVEFLLAVGGGSVLDATKFISAAIHHEDEPWKILSERQPIKDTTSMGFVLTLPATGSEMNSFAVISNGKEKLGFGGDPRLYAKFAVLDPEVTFSLPEKQLGNGIVDAFVHVSEQYLTKNINTPLQDRFAEGILHTLIEEAPKIMAKSDDYDARANFMWSATQALNGIIGVGVVQDWATHMIGHELTALHGIDHGRSLAIVLPSLLREEKDNKKEKLLQFADRIWNLNTGSEDERIEAAITKMESFFESVGVPTKLSAYSLDEECIGPIVKSLRTHIPVNLGENQNIDETKVSKMLRMSL